MPTRAWENSLDRSTDFVYRVVFSPVGKRIVTASSDNIITAGKIIM
jgi:WD40 repeat protein